MRRISLGALGFLLAASVNTASAQSPAARPAGPPPSGPGEVKGSIVDSASKIGNANGKAMSANFVKSDPATKQVAK